MTAPIHFHTIAELAPLVASAAATRPSRTRDAAVVGAPRRSIKSFSEIGIP